MKKRERIDILIDIVRLKGNLKELKEELSKFEFNSKEAILVLSKIDFYYVIKECLAKNISIDDLEDWMNTIEYRDDIDIEDEKISELIFELASPEINGEITEYRLNNILDELNVR